MFKLVIQDDEGKTTVVPLIRDEITIGRKEGNTIRLTERNVSRRHARILRNNGEVHIEDLGSYNGIRVNNARIAERVSLRVSDQVQIGDYKLYLKAEGVEQVDEARTVPIERVENAVATEVMAALSATPTAQIPVVATAAAPTAPNVAPVVGDAGGRPVATAAQVAALTAPAGYGKLVVVSSNFAGKEFDLTRPQMIIGRTDENDIVVNHRSISRNHAKVTRDPETGRYTISDLQSSNGVRVNGQDYGKVELRRADEVDLGHVRLRFVEPGEDFVFARDARIADIADTGGGGRGLLVAILLGVIVLAAAGGYFLLANKDSGGSGGKTGSAEIASGSQDHVASGTGGSDVIGSGTAAKPAVVETPADASEGVAQVGAASGSDNGSDDQKTRLETKCQTNEVDKKWSDLVECANELKAFDKPASSTFATRAKAELDGEQRQKQLNEMLNASPVNWGQAKKLVNNIPAEAPDAKTAAGDLYKHAADAAIAQLHDQATKAREAHKCDPFNKAIASAQKIDDHAPTSTWGTCEAAQVAVVSERPRPPPTGSGSSGTAVVTPPAACDADDLKKQGYDANSGGKVAEAASYFEQSYKCKQDVGVLRLVVMFSCKAQNTGMAKKYYQKAPAGVQGALVQSCLESTGGKLDLGKQ